MATDAEKPSKRFCPNCGAALKAGVAFCGKCGTGGGGGATRIPKVAVILAVVVAAAVVGVWFMLGGMTQGGAGSGQAGTDPSSIAKIVMEAAGRGDLATFQEHTTSELYAQQAPYIGDYKYTVQNFQVMDERVTGSRAYVKFSITIVSGNNTMQGIYTLNLTSVGGEWKVSTEPQRV